MNILSSGSILIKECRYKSGLSHEQVMLLSSIVDDYLTADNPARAIDAYVESLDLEGMGFVNQM